MKNKSNLFMTISWTWFAIWFLFLLVFYYFVNRYIHERNTISEVCIEKKCFTVEMARTPAEQQQWLMNRQVMEASHGMIFMFPKTDVYNFRMKNTLIPLDMIRIDDQNHVVRVLTAQPCTQDPCIIYQPEVSAKYVIEINAWLAVKYGITGWKVMEFRNIE